MKIKIVKLKMWKLKCNEIKIKYFANILLIYENIVIYHFMKIIKLRYVRNENFWHIFITKLHIFITDIFEAIRYTK